MGFLSAIGGLIGAGARKVGGVIKKIGDVGMSVAKRIGEFAPQVGASLGGLIGNNPVGQFLKDAGSKVGEVASGAGLNIARTVGNIGRGVMNIGRQVGGQAGQPNDSG
jgi:hypothetical protein